MGAAEWAPLLGVLLTCIAAIFGYRQSERHRERELANEIAAARRPTLNVIGGAIASQEGTKLYVEEFQRLIHAIDRLTAAFSVSAEAQTAGSERWRKTVDELERIRRAMEDVASAAERIRREERAEREGH